MKVILSSLILFVCFSVVAQSKTELEQLQEVYSNETTWENPGSLTYDETTNLLAIKNYRIPVATSTHIRAEKNLVRFYMQNNTAVTDVNDETWKRADFTIPFRNKKSASVFVRHFNKVKESR